MLIAGEMRKVDMDVGERMKVGGHPRLIQVWRGVTSSATRAGMTELSLLKRHGPEAAVLQYSFKVTTHQELW
eukprot:2163704-Rhodomonas_salina.2